MEAELAATRTEHRRITKAIALADDIPELVSELKQRVARIEQLEAQLSSARNTPSEIRAFAKAAERAVLDQIDDLKTALADRQDLREVFLNLFHAGPDVLAYQARRQRAPGLEGFPARLTTACLLPGPV